jgi:hypothetical protein
MHYGIGFTNLLSKYGRKKLPTDCRTGLIFPIHKKGSKINVKIVEELLFFHKCTKYCHVFYTTE